MDMISQAVRIILGLVAVLAAGILLAPAQPTLFAARSDAPPVSVAPDVAQEASAPAAVDTPRPAPVEPAEPAATPTPPPSEVAAVVQPPAPGPVEPPAVVEPFAEEPVVELAPPPVQPIEEAAPAATEIDVTGDAEEAEPEAPSLAELTAEPPPLDFRLYREPQVTAATTLRADGRDIRLAGLDTLPPEARCASGAPCGETARRAVSGFLAGRSIICSVTVGRADGDEVSAPCLAGEDDIGAWIVRNGWADAGPGSRYSDDAETARSEGRGIWAEGGPAIGD